jgi:histidinol-phosphate aminotransferase
MASDLTNRVHGGPDTSGAAPWDFSTCANACGPCPDTLEAVRGADPVRYPDPSGTALRERLAQLHGVAPQRILLAASASEFIQRVTAVSTRLLPGPVRLPRHAYGDYAAAAAACDRAIQREGDDATLPTLRWCADPSSPRGEDALPPLEPASIPTVLDAVYAPLRLQGAGHWGEAERAAVFVLHSPNKALGLCGVRGAYAVAPSGAAWDVGAWCHALEAAAPSWPLSAQGVAMLDSWARPETQQWVRDTHARLQAWKDELARMLLDRGFIINPSSTPFFCVQPPHSAKRPTIGPAALRRQGVAVRDASSFGLPGWWRVSAQPPESIAALAKAMDALASAS